MIPLHEELKEIRLEKGVRLEDISKITKIRIDLLEKLEEGNFSIVPMPYLRAFLREYAEVVGADPDRVIAKFEKKTSRIRDVQPSDEEKSPPSEKTGTPEKTTQITGDETESENEETETPSAENPLEEEAFPEDTEKTSSAEITPSEVQKPDEETPPGEDESAPVSEQPVPETEPLPPEENSQPALFDDVKETTIDTETEDNPEEVVTMESDTPVSTVKRKRLEIEEPKSSSTLFFFVFIGIIILAAIIIVWLNRSGVF